MAYHVVNTMDFHRVDTLRMAIERFGKPEIFNSDQGRQFTSAEFVGELRNYGVKISMDGRGRCLDNAEMERFWWALKYENTKSRSMSVCRNCASAFSTMSTFTIRSGFTRPCATRRRMKSVLLLAISKTEGMVTQRPLHRSFNEKPSSQGARRKRSRK